MYKVKKDDREEFEYLNISIHTPSKIGRSLAYTATFNAVHTLIGKITSLRPAMDYIVTPKYPVKLLSKGKLTDKDIANIPTDKVEVVNKDAIFVHLIFERIWQDKTLYNKLMELDPDIKFTSFNTKKNTVSNLTSKVTNYNDSSNNYLEILSKIYHMMHIYKGDDESLVNHVKTLINNTKQDKTKGLFTGVPFNIKFDDRQLLK